MSELIPCLGRGETAGGQKWATFSFLRSGEMEGSENWGQKLLPFRAANLLTKIARILFN